MLRLTDTTVVKAAEETLLPHLDLVVRLSLFVI